MSENFNPSNQKKLMELVVGQVLKKHKVSPKDIDLTKKEKKKIKEIVGDIEGEVQRFLENQNKQLTEQDFSTESTSTSTPETSQINQAPQSSTPQRQTFQSTNDVTSVKTFFNRRK
ncbi:hypothetical protein [Alkalihalobacterium chitinilyticum]|uniref:Spore coat protein n=1 Tax=Alkalihalobacterium chitinilyticum TaxID=2980103 RepID=A0ABT5VCH9_9BACI|nr:hypothetical protein [Alkalihalobacterium chitinilyticum]MDE5413153.1 hypothetical protein [Alkalihalobacterium chitinilyticum]